jgi:hypothetical protein
MPVRVTGNLGCNRKFPEENFQNYISKITCIDQIKLEELCVIRQYYVLQNPK